MKRKPIEYRRISGGKVHIVRERFGYMGQPDYYCGNLAVYMDAYVKKPAPETICKTCLRLRAKDEA